MTKYPDGSILILPDEKDGVTALIEALDKAFVRETKPTEKEIFIKKEGFNFICKWEELNKDKK